MIVPLNLKISIALATFNGGEYLHEQLVSFANQERLPDELVACDDGSTDDTLHILEEFKHSAPFDVIIIKNNQNLGFTKNFEKALSTCTGDLIFLSDQDDFWFPNKIIVVEQAILENPDKLLVIHDGELVDENLVSKGTTKRGQVVAGYGVGAFFTTGALTAIHRDLLPYVLPIPAGIVGHDGWLHNIARILGRRLLLDQSLQYIRRHSSNTSKWVVNSMKPINWFSVAKSQSLTIPSNSYQDRMIYNTTLTERLLFIKSLKESCVSTQMINSELVHLRSERKSIVNREELVSLGNVRRKMKALRMLVCGDYMHFNGFKSFMRDLIR